VKQCGESEYRLDRQVAIGRLTEIPYRDKIIHVSISHRPIARHRVIPRVFHSHLLPTAVRSRFRRREARQSRASFSASIPRALPYVESTRMTSMASMMARKRLLPFLGTSNMSFLAVENRAVVPRFRAEQRRSRYSDLDSRGRNRLRKHDVNSAHL